MSFYDLGPFFAAGLRTFADWWQLVVADIQWWAMTGTWVNALAMTAAAVFAALAWRAQVRYSRVVENRAGREAAVGHAADAIRDLTTGRVSRARRRVADWTTDFEENPPSHARLGAEALRSESVAGKSANTKLRDQVFVLLWSLQRLGPLAEDLALAQPSQRHVLFSHINLVTESLRRFAERLEVHELSLFRESAQAATDSLLLVAASINNNTFEQSMAWSLALSGFTLEIVYDDETVESRG